MAEERVNKYTREYPKRALPPLTSAVRVDSDGIRRPVMAEPFAECGSTVYLRGIGWVQCVRRAGHSVDLALAHANGLGEQWAFDE